MPLTAKEALKYASETIAHVRREQEHTAAQESEKRIQRLLGCLTPSAWSDAGKSWAQSNFPEHKTPSIALDVVDGDVPAFLDALHGLGYTTKTKHVPECKERGYEWEAHTSVSVLLG